MIARATIVALGALMLASPAASFAQTAPDPDSPAGVEYALPLDQARRQANEGSERPKPSRRERGSDGQSGSSREPAPLFGAGVSRGGGSGSGDSSSSGGNTGGGGSRDDSGSGQSGDAGADGAGESTSPERDAERTAGLAGYGGGGGNGTLIGVVAAILLVGAGAGLGLRRFLGTPRA